MNATIAYALTPIARVLRTLLFTPLLLAIPAYAQSPYPSKTGVGLINLAPGQPTYNWRLLGAHFSTSAGVTTGFITANQSARISLIGTIVDGTGVESAIAIEDGTTLSMSGSTVSGGNTGITAGFASTPGVNSTRLSIDNSSISGTVNGILNYQNNHMDISNSVVSGGDRGILAIGGTARITGSTITGGKHGIFAPSSTRVTPFNLTLDGSHVAGQTDSAILLSNQLLYGPDPVVIDVLNGSTLTGGNGIALEIFNSNANVGVRNSDLAGNILVRDKSSVALDFDQARLTGDVIAEADARVDLSLANSELAGSVLVRDNSTALLSLDQSRMTGDIIAEAGSQANLTLANRSIFTGRLENVANVAINSSAQWVMVEDSTVANLAMDGGAVKMGAPDAFYTLSVDNLSGNGLFIMDADFAQGTVDFLDVTGTATGNHTLLVGATGADPVADSTLHVVRTAAGDAQFELLNGTVDMGTYSYSLMQQDGNNWYLANTGKVTPSTSAVLALFNTAPTVWYGELSTLRSRMGELRISGAQPGGWIRSYGNKFDAKAASGVGYQQTQQGLSFGADAPLPLGDGQWLVGVLGGYSKSDLDLDRGTSGEVKSYYVGAYTTWMDAESGYYVDGVLKFNRFSNEADVSMSDGKKSRGDYDNSGVGASLEFGKHVKFDNGYFIEPYTQLSAVIIQGKDYELNNGMQAEGDRTRSLLGKLGTTAGRTFDLGAGKALQPYVRAAYVHEFAKNNDVEVNNNVFNNDLSGSRGELGTGIALSMSDTLQLHADFEYSQGKKLDQPWGANVGLRYSW